MSNKIYYFISGLPRSGTTLLAAILNQNPRFYADIYSPLLNTIDAVKICLTASQNSTLVDNEQRKNFFEGMIDGFYKHVEKPIVFDSNRRWSSHSTFLNTLYPHTKIICCVRDIVQILNSFETIRQKNSLHGYTLNGGGETVYTRCEELMARETGIVSKAVMSLREGGMVSPEMIYLVEYESLCKNPENTMRSIYNFIEQPYFNHDFNNVIYSNESFDRSINLEGLHTLRKKVEYKPPKCILPADIVDECSQRKMEFWK